MSKSKRQHPYNFGRVFFPGTSNPIPPEIRFQPLGNHVGNVKRLVKHWQDSDFPCESSFKRVLKAADIHDMGKPQKFFILVQTNSKGKFSKYIYSFRGHRFLAESKEDAWAQALARGHHDFSVEDISRDTYKLKNLKKEQQDNDTIAESYAKILGNDPLAYARELYILEMCDQIEAELACRVLGDEDQAESRTFMDYTIARDDSDKSVYLIDPWPFKKDSIELTFEYWSMQPTAEDQVKLQKYQEDNRDRELGNQLDKIVKDWWQSQPDKPELQPSLKATLKPYPSINTYKDLDCQSLYQLLAGFEPNPMQAEMFKAIANNDHPAILLKGSTGCGKTESILFPALAKGYRLFLPLTARSLLEDQEERIEKYLKKFSGLPENKDREFSLVVDTGSQMYRWVYKNSEESKPHQINPRRHLYKGDVILTTLDKFLYRYFAFGDKQKSFTFPLRIHRDRTHNEKTLICFDEAHSYDDISFTNFQSLVQSLYEAGRSLVLMTATMPPESTEGFDYLDVIDYVDDSDNAEALRQFQQKVLKQSHPEKKGFEWISDIEHNPDNPEIFQNKFAKIILKEWQLKASRRIIAIVETVKDAAVIYQWLKNELGFNTDTRGQFLFLYHGRIADQLRPELYNKLKKRDAECQPYILITTSAIEVGCDLNSEVLISQLCPPENLIQRAGRCNRKGNISDAKVILVGNSIPDFTNSLDESGWQKYQETLQSIKQFDTLAISKCISRTHEVNDYRVVELFSMLHEYVYGADLTCKPAHEKGLVITRSWKPSVTLTYKNGNSNPSHTITVPIDRLLKNKNKEYSNTHAYERYYNQETTRWESRDLGWGSAYLKDIYVEISPNSQGAEVFDGKEEYPYNEELGFAELPGVFIKFKFTTGFDEKLLYKHTEKQIAIITYTKSLDADADIA